MLPILGGAADAVVPAPPGAFVLIRPGSAGRLTAAVCLA